MSAEPAANTYRPSRTALLALVCIAAAVVALLITGSAPTQTDEGQRVVFDGGSLALVAVAGLGLRITRRRDAG